MNLSDSLSGPRLEQPVSTPVSLALTEAQKVDVHVDGLISNGLQRVYGPASEQARASIARARAEEGAGAFDRIADTPGAFAPVENAAFAPHLREAHRYEEWLAAERGATLPDTHVLDRPSLPTGSDAPDRRGTQSVQQTVQEGGLDGPGVSLDVAPDASEIKRLLDPEVHPTTLDYGVMERDLQEIQAIVERFPIVEYGSLVLSRLDQTELGRWAENLVDPGYQGGFSASERLAYYSVLAAHLDVVQLDRFAQR